MKNLQTYQVPSPLGDINYVADADGTMFVLGFADKWPKFDRYITKHLALANTQIKTGGPHKKALADYFAGDCSALDAIPVKVFGTDFQTKAWLALRDINTGEARSYLQQATGIGRAKSVRAIGMANGANPISLVLPCHRVIGSSRKLTGYGGGIERKAWLLRHEGAEFLD